jgi:DNA-binding transcriptional LysR family regulator
MPETLVHALDLHQLEIFCRIVELKSFSRAAEALFLTQPTLSSHMANLERALATRLLDRLGRSVVPTRTGLCLYGYARRILDLRREAVQAIDAELGLVRGELIVGGSTIPGVYILPGLVGQFKKKHDGIRVTLLLGDSKEMTAEVEAGEVEVALVGLAPEANPLSSRPFGRDFLALVVPPDHRLAGKKTATLAELKKEPFLIREAGSGTRGLMDSVLAKHGCRVSSDLNVICELGSTEAVKEGVKAGMGVSIVSRRAIEHEVKTGALAALDIDGIAFERRFHLVHNAERTSSPVATAFLKFLGTVKI